MNYPKIFFRTFGSAFSLLICFALFGARITSAQESQTKTFVENLSLAEAKTVGKQWGEAAVLWEKIVKANPFQARFWNQLALSYFNAKDYRKSISAYEKQIELGYGLPANAAYKVACAYALLGEKEQAIKWLEKAFAMRFPDLPRAQTDADLESIRNDSRYRKLVGLIDTSRMSREEGWRADLGLLNREIKRKGYNLFPRTGTEADFDAAVKKLNDAIPKLTDGQIIVEIAKLMRRVGDAHSGLIGGDRSDLSQNLPVQFYLFEEGLFIISADPKYKDLVGAQILKFGTHSPDEIVKGIEPTISRDNDIWIKQTAPYQMRNLNLLNSLGLVPDTDKVSFVVRRMNGAEQTVTLATDQTQPDIWNVQPNPPNWINVTQILSAPAPLYLKNMGANYWFEFLPQNKTVYFQFNRVLNDEKESLAAFSERLLKFVSETAEVEKLVIDMRWNNGGDTVLVTPLTQGLIKNEKINKRGKLFVVIGRRTFSAAQNTATFIERHTNAIFVGEPTGSSPNFVGEEAPFTLPYSKLVANVSDLYWESAFPQDHRTWIAPQIYVPPTFKAYRANRDSALEAILEYR